MTAGCRENAVGYACRMEKRYGTIAGARALLFIAALASLPVVAEDVAFEGRTLEVDVGNDTRTITRVVGTLYQINGTADQIANKARRCLSSQQGVAVAPAEASSSLLVANSRANFRSLWSTHSIRSQLAIEVSDGHFQVIQSGLGVAQASAASASDDAYAPLQHQGAGWDNALSATIAVEQGVIDCLYR